MSKRKSLSKKDRFEVFKRDGFTCQYCGKQPPDTILVVDHIHPVAEGGDNDRMNLITSCEPCNQGKGARTLGQVAPKPDADLEYLKIQQETAELRRYIIAKQERDQLYQELLDVLKDHWRTSFETSYAPDDAQWRLWLNHGTPEIIERSIDVAAGRRIHYSERERYVSGVFWNLLKDDQ